MKNQFLKISVLSITALFFSCSDDDSITPNSNSSTSYKGTQSPGDVWEWDFDAENLTFTASWDHGTFEDTSDDVSVNGNYQILPSGFYNCTVTGSDNTNDIPNNTTFYAFEVPGIALLVKPENGDLITAAAAGDCGDVAGEYTFVKIAPGLDDNNNVENPLTTAAYGNYSLTSIDGGFSVSGSESSLDCANGGLGTCTIDNESFNISAAVTCENNGQITVHDLNTNEIVAEGQFGDVSMVIDQGYGNGGVIGFKKSAAFNPSSEELLGVTFTGVAYLPYNTGNDKVLPVQVSWIHDENNALVGEGSLIGNVETGEIDAETTVVLDITDIPGDGSFSGAVNYPVNDYTIGKNYQGILVESAGQQMMVITTVNQNDEPYTLVLVRK